MRRDGPETAGWAYGRRAVKARFWRQIQPAEAS